MASIYVYLTTLPAGIHEMVVPCSDGYTVYIDEGLDDAHRRRAYEHALEHIEYEDWDKIDVQEIETEAHSA